MPGGERTQTAEVGAEERRKASERRANRNRLAHWVFGILAIVAGAVAAAAAAIFSEDPEVAGVAGAVAGLFGGIATFGRFAERQKYHQKQAVDYNRIVTKGGTWDESGA